MSPSEHRSIARILKVNHAGEYGAIRIYRAQLWVARRLYPDLVPFLSETLGHEIEHCALFANAMVPRDTRPCRIMSLWGNGGYVLGFTTALMGRQGIWICTSAVERTVHRHLDDQLAFLRDKDADLFGLIQSIQTEEASHLAHADAHISHNGPVARVLRGMITLATETLIALSTWGESLGMARNLRRNRPQ